MKRSSLLGIVAVMNLIAISSCVLLAMKYQSIVLVCTAMILMFTLFVIINAADKSAAEERRLKEYEEERDRHMCEMYDQQDYDDYLPY